MMHSLDRFLAAGACALVIACSGGSGSGPDDASVRDASTDDASVTDAGADASGPDASNPGMDAGNPGMDAGGAGMDASPPLPDAGDAGPDAGDAGADAGPERIQAYVNADSGDDENAGTSEAPFKTVQRAFEAVGEDGLVWLQPSTFTNATEGLVGTNTYTGREVPANTLLRATDEGVSLGMTLRFPAGGGLEGVSLNLTEIGRVLVSGGTVNLRAITWVRSGGPGVTQGLEVTDSGRVVLEPGDDADHNYVGAPGILSALAIVRDSAELTIEGGVADGATGAGVGNLIDLAGESRLTLRNFTLSNQSGALVSGGAGVWMGGARCTVLIEDSRIDLGNNAGSAACIVQDDNYSAGSPDEYGSLTIRDSVLTNCRGSALQLREGEPEVHIEDSELSGSGARFGIEAGQIGFDSVKVAGRPSLTLVNTIIRGNYLGGIAMNRGGTLAITGGSVDTNGSAGNGRGGIWLEGVHPYDVSMRGVTITDNAGPSGYAGVWLGGDATSTFDLGTAASPGNNTLTGNAPTQLSVRVADGVIVSAVGNTWTASAQGADGDGHYTVAGAFCANANPCDQTAGADVNFTFTSAGAGAALRLAAQ